MTARLARSARYAEIRAWSRSGDVLRSRDLSGERRRELRQNLQRRLKPRRILRGPLRQRQAAKNRQAWRDVVGITIAVGPLALLVAVGNDGGHEQRRGDGLLEARLLARVGGQPQRAFAALERVLDRARVATEAVGIDRVAAA